VLVTGGALVCPAGDCRALPVDAAGLALLDGARQPLLDHGFAAVTWLGSLLVLAPAALYVWRRERQLQPPRAAAFVPMALAGAVLLAHLVKLAADRPRPDLFTALVPMPMDLSYPSAHAMQATAFALAVLLRPGARPTAAVAILACLLIAVVGISRLYLQVHYPSDVAFGVAAAALWVLALRCLPVWREHAR
jgi:undecaprenyl-diphosphatase